MSAVLLIAGAALAKGIRATVPRQRQGAGSSSSSSRQSRIAMRVTPVKMPGQKLKVVSATKRFPLWRLSEEMYLHRNLAPDPRGSWNEIKRAQAKMQERIREQQVRDMRDMEREIAGWRLPPTRNVSSLRKGMWLDGRVSEFRENGVMVDVGAYTDKGLWVDGYLDRSQIRADGWRVFAHEIKDYLYLGEHIRVRVDEIMPTTGKFCVSLKKEPDWPELFMGKPRVSLYELRTGMKVKGVIRRMAEFNAVLDIGTTCMASLSVYHAPKPKDKFGFPIKRNRYEYTWQVFAVGAELDCYIYKIVDTEKRIFLITDPVMASAATDALHMKNDPGRADEATPGPPGTLFPETERRQSWRDRKQAKKLDDAAKEWEPRVYEVENWLQESIQPDHEMDAWVARQERDLFEDNDDDEDDEDEDEDEEPMFEEFADDEFAADEFIDHTVQPVRQRFSDLDDWDTWDEDDKKK